MNSRVKKSTGKASREKKLEDFLSIFVKKGQYKVGDKVRISKYDSPFSHSLRVKFLKLLSLLLKSLQHTTSRETRVMKC